MSCIEHSAAGAPEKGVRSSRQVTFAGVERGYNLYVPNSTEGQKVPLMLVLHGGMGNAERIEKSTAMNAIADGGKFVVAYPQGTAPPMRGMGDLRTWNAGNCCGAALRRNVDDVGFISAVIDDVAAAQPIDLSRVYVVGMSNGAMLAYRLACELPERLAAIVAVSGTLGVDDCSRAKDVAVLHIHGDQDRNVPLEGGRGEDSLAGVEYRSVSDSIALLLRARGSSSCERKNPSESIELAQYRCSAGAPVELVVLKGNGHAWPGAVSDSDSGANPAKYPASEQAWSFLRQFARPN